MGNSTTPLVSVIVPTLNSEEFLEACLQSIRAQTYKNIELIVVDNFSKDRTQEIAKKYADKVLSRGPERSAQLNYGVEQANGQYVYKVDSDFTLDENVIQECIDKAAQGFDAVVVHNTPNENISWVAKIRKFEVDMYKYDLQHSSARFLKKATYLAIEGFNPAITAGEDYDFQNKLNRGGYTTGFIQSEALHHGEPKSFWGHLRKCYGYGKDAANYQKDNPEEFNGQLKFILLVWVHHWRKFLRHPLRGAGLLLYYFFKFSFAGAGLLKGKFALARQGA